MLQTQWKAAALAGLVTLFSASAALAERSGSEVYQQFCAACHNPGILNAPKPNDAADWQDRLSAGKDTLLANTISGLQAMPPRGACGNCSDAELKAAIDHMVGDL
ncbi:c-type cytochrome [Marinimicrobium alkaliphilum]|uniref:c-type cytochrome n=1 Tax=Marinimicrobium alkaliphilum TaxID=2202654 RepID=UPI0013006C53|nr:c-type cytochrome [Marinimicrobium alkaliphilum]